MSQNVYQILCMCQHKLGQRWYALKFLRISAKHFNVTNRIKLMFATICNIYCITHCKIQMICLINSQKPITVCFFSILERWWCLEFDRLFIYQGQRTCWHRTNDSCKNLERVPHIDQEIIYESRLTRLLVLI